MILPQKSSIVPNAPTLSGPGRTDGELEEGAVYDLSHPSEPPGAADTCLQVEHSESGP